MYTGDSAPALIQTVLSWWAELQYTKTAPNPNPILQYIVLNGTDITDMDIRARDITDTNIKGHDYNGHI